jgi:regulator of replication initiation timing
MKKIAVYLSALLLMVSFGCQQKSADEHEGHDAEAGDVVEASGNQELYNEVMKIHDEVMPKMEDIHRLKQTLKEKIEKTPNLSKAERIELDAITAKLDSANESMMTWMHEFSPLPDSLGEEKARAYLEGEIERVKKVRANILEALEAAKGK